MASMDALALWAALQEKVAAGTVGAADLAKRVSVIAGTDKERGLLLLTWLRQGRAETSLLSTVQLPSEQPSEEPSEEPSERAEVLCMCMLVKLSLLKTHQRPSRRV